MGNSLWNILWTSRKTDSGRKELRRVHKVYYADEYNPDDNVKLGTYIGVNTVCTKVITGVRLSHRVWVFYKVN